MKLGQAVRIAKTVKVDHAKRFAQHVVPEVVRPARVIWNQAIGGIFIFFAIAFLGYAINYYKGLGTEPRNAVALGLALFMGIIMLILGIGSFRKARRISRP